MNENTSKQQRRTPKQNNALHAYLGMVAHELQNQGQTLQNVVTKIPLIEITPTTQALKEVLFRPIMVALIGKTSTTELTTSEIGKVYDMMSVFLAREFGIDIAFPSEEQSESYLKSLERTQ